MLENVDKETLQILKELRKTYIDWDPQTDKFYLIDAQDNNFE